MAVILSGLKNIVSHVFGGLHYVVGSDGETVFIERFPVNSSANLQFDGEEDRVEVCSGAYPGFWVDGGKLIVSVVDVGDFISYDGGNTWEELL